MGIQDMFRVLKFSRSFPVDDQKFIRASDGAVCRCTIITCSRNAKPIDIRLKLCSLCTMVNISQCPEVTLREGFRFSLCLGQSPDIGFCQNTERFAACPGTIRQILESCISNSRKGELLHLDLEAISLEEYDNNLLSLEVQVDEVILPPQCNKTSSIDSELKDVRDNMTIDWNSDLQLNWLERALKLKERGSQIIRLHSSDVNGKNIDLEKWSTAFSFYSRALQLISLANLANETCNTTDSYGVHAKNGVMQCANDYLDLNEILSGEDSSKLNEVKPKQLEFNLLLNLALCQLKFGTAEFCAENCSQALTLDPGWVDFDSTTDVEVLTSRADEFGIGYSDICKALYRRSQAYFAVGKLDEAETDLKTISRILKIHDANDPNSPNFSILSAAESLLSRIRELSSKEHALLASRLRNRQNLFS